MVTGEKITLDGGAENKEKVYVSFRFNSLPPSSSLLQSLPFGSLEGGSLHMQKFLFSESFKKILEASQLPA